MQKFNYEEPQAVDDSIYWIGFHDKKANLHCNPYLLIDEQDIIIFDPGSITHFPKVARKIFDLVDPGKINYMVVSHPDPDVCSNMAIMEEIIDNPALKIITHTKSARLLQHFGLQSEYYLVDQHNFQINFKNGRTMQFVDADFLHAPGAITTFDQKSGALFSSDIFGAVSDDWNLFMESEKDLEKMKPFHQEYMPSNQILRRYLEQIKKLEIKKILPQHGSVIKGEYIKKAIDYLYNLSCGYDLK